MPSSQNGIPYLPDGVIGTEPPDSGPEPRAAWKIVVLFVLVFAALQTGWSLARDTAIERLVIHRATVQPATWLIGMIDPDLAPTARGSRIEAPGGGLNIQLGCEGIEIMFLLTAAMVAIPLAWRHRLRGLGLGLLLVFVLNQARIVALFFAWRADRNLFEALHTMVLPALLVIAVTIYVFALVERTRPAAAR